MVTPVECDTIGVTIFKILITDEATVAVYHENKLLILIWDDSEIGLGAMLAHTMEDGIEKPMAYASRMPRKCSRQGSFRVSLWLFKIPQIYFRSSFYLGI